MKRGWLRLAASGCLTACVGTIDVPVEVPVHPITPHAVALNGAVYVFDQPVDCEVFPREPGTAVKPGPSLEVVVASGAWVPGPRTDPVFIITRFEADGTRSSRWRAETQSAGWSFDLINAPTRRGDVARARIGLRYGLMRDRLSPEDRQARAMDIPEDWELVRVEVVDGQFDIMLCSDIP